MIAMSLAILSVPVFDTLRVMTRRIYHRQSPFHPDKTHLHHVFIKAGISHSITTLLILLIYRIGNAVPVQLGEAIGRAILADMAGEPVDERFDSFPFSRYRRTSDTTWSL